MKKECSTCGGSGQIGFFQGESRFLLTWEECPECLGTGLTDQEREKPDDRVRRGRSDRSESGKKKKG